MLNNLRYKLQNQFLQWSRVRERLKALLTEFVTKPRDFSLGGGPHSHRGMSTSGIFNPPRKISTAKSEHPLGGTFAEPWWGLSALMPVLRATAGSRGAYAANTEEATSTSSKSMQENIKREADQDEMALQELKSKVDSLKQRVACLAVLCRKHTELVLSSRLMESEFHFLHNIVRKREAEAEVSVLLFPLPEFIEKELNVHCTRLPNLLELLRRSEPNEKVQLALDEGPLNDEAIHVMIVDFIKKGFALSFLNPSY